MLSIEISGRQIRLVEGQWRAGALQVTGFDSAAAPEGSVKGGVLTAPAELAAVLRASIQKNHFRSRQAVLTLGGPAVATREVVVPAVKPKQMAHVLRGEIEQMNSAKQEHLLDYVTLEREGADQLRVLCVVVPRVLVASYRELIASLGLKPAGMDVAAHAIYPLARVDRQLSGPGAAILAWVGPEEINLALVESRSRIFYRSAPVGAPAQQMQSEFILSSLSLDAMGGQAAQQERTYAAASENIAKLIQFQVIKNREQPVDRILLCGPMAQDEGLARRLAADTGLSAAPVAAPAFIRCAGPALPYSQYLYALGVLIGS